MKGTVKGTDEILRMIWPVFRAEGREIVQAISTGVLALEAGEASPDTQESVQRLAHSLKGSAASVGVEDFVALAHAIEDALVASQALPRVPHTTAEAIFGALDAMERALAGAEEPGVLRVDGAAERVARLHAAVAEVAAVPGAAPASPPEAPATAPPAGREAAPEPAPVEVAAAVERGAPGAPSLPAPERPPARTAPPGSPAPGHAERSIRVLESTIDEIGGYVESLALAHAAAERRAHALLDLGQQLQDAIQLARGAEGGGVGLVTALDRAAELARDVGRHGTEAQREAMRQKLEATAVRDDLRDLRMVPIAVALEPLRRTVRDAARQLGKSVELSLSGGELRLDRQIVDAIKDPLVHLVRNAVDHGIEAEAVRAAAKKPAAGRIGIQVQARGHRVSVQVSDDGAGLSADRIRRKAVERGVLAAADAGGISDREVFRLVFTPGFSTAEQVTSVSGRGVGLDVVQSAVARLQGTVELTSVPGRGATFELDLPLALSVTLAVLVRLDDERTAIPAETVERVLRLPPDHVGLVLDRRVARVGSTQLPYASLRELLERSEAARPEDGALQPALLLRLADRRMVLGVDEVLGERELVVRSLGRRGAGATLLAGAALLDDGAVVSVLNPAMLFGRLQPARAVPPARKARVVVADDSLTSRATVKAILEIAGYAVTPAADGEAAWQHVTRGGVELVVSDVQMPRLDGLGLARRIKADPAYRGIPVVLVTSLAAPEDRRAGMLAGADGYLVKKDVESGKLLELVEMLLPQR